MYSNPPIDALAVDLYVYVKIYDCNISKLRVTRRVYYIRVRNSLLLDPSRELSLSQDALAENLVAPCLGPQDRSQGIFQILLREISWQRRQLATGLHGLDRLTPGWGFRLEAHHFGSTA